LLIFPGTGQRHQHNPNGSTGSKTIAKANDGNAAINQPGPARSIRSFRRPPLWQRPPQDHAQEVQEMEVLDRQKRKDCRPACLAKGQAFIIEFLQGSSIHGFIYLGAENEGSASASDSLLTSSTASLLPSQDNNRRLGPGPGLLIFPGTGQRHQHNPNGSTGSKTIAKANDGNAAINQPGPARSIRSFRRPPLWQRPPQDHAQEVQEMEVLDRQKRKDCRPACLAKGQAFIIEFLQGSSIHGFIYLAKLGLSFVER